MLTFLGAGAVMVMILGLGTPTVFAQQTIQEWKTFYSPEYRFSLNYPTNESTTTITDNNSSDFQFGKQFSTPPINFTVMVKQSTMDPQEYTIAYSQKLPSYFDTLEGGKITPIVEDGVVGYLLRAINEQNGSWNYIISFSNNGYLYAFTFETPFNGSDIDQVNSIVDSIKFFD
ncbi:PsbP-related protein [Candidatus Nitrosocosmicus arcticus]|uniref:PsbP C-terminal domain-containing protein n=1 Tax=Candidatus Nitrosocosmicus arcticus TaxID=2035267 RepID=A0A557SVT3_9ARCH|nr:hypothetical protein [Candidatus Nitrosocosmicus arcticus]TVP40715.1 exported protein of unknown function [Candidatus Nitrosocosmicus arcticus]